MRVLRYEDTINNDGYCSTLMPEQSKIIKAAVCGKTLKLWILCPDETKAVNDERRVFRLLAGLRKVENGATFICQIDDNFLFELTEDVSANDRYARGQNMKIVQPVCYHCGAPLQICEGDVVQIYQEMSDELECICPHCGAKNAVHITDETVKLEARAL